MDLKQRTIENFNDELQSLLENKPPVSKTKMVSITRAAMKGVKYYKHIVQLVEKFILRCKPEYKVPGLYVIDSIVRQSRHQFGTERDVYASRFSRNIQLTFNNLFTGCLNDDKPKIVRVLNLWQKNGVFNSQLIQPLLDMANPNSAYTLPTESTLSADSPGNISNLEHSSKQGQSSKYSAHHPYNSNQYNKGLANNKYNRTGSSSMNGPSGNLVFDKNLLDFDYDEDDDDFGIDGPNGVDDGDETPTEAEPPLSSTLNKIELEQINRSDVINSNNSGYPPTNQQISRHGQQLPHQSQSNQTHTTRNEPDLVLERWNRLLRQQNLTNENSNDNQVDSSRQPYERQRSRSPPNPRENRNSLIRPQKIENPPVDPPSSPKRESPDRKSERKAERARKCLPSIRDKHLTVCSSTLWLGHVPKTVSEADISDAFGEFGAITSIDLIPPRGCAYVCMDRRQDAKKALKESRDLKLNGSHIKMAWAPGKGFKEYKKLKDFWEVDIGCSYIPYNKIDSSIDFDILEEGGVIDDDSMSMEMREIRERRNKLKEETKAITHPPEVSLPIPALPILSQPPPPFSLGPRNPLHMPQQSHISVTQANHLNMPPQPSQLTMPPPPNHQLSLQQAGLAMTQADMMLAQSNLSLPPPNLAMHPPLNVLNQGQLQFPQPGGIPFWTWGN